MQGGQLWVHKINTLEQLDAYCVLSINSSMDFYVCNLMTVLHRLSVNNDDKCPALNNYASLFLHCMYMCISQSAILLQSSKCVCSYNKTERDFNSLKEYNDYLEEVETISKLYALAIKQLIYIHVQ